MSECSYHGATSRFLHLSDKCIRHDIYKHLIFPSSLRKHLHADIDKPVQVWVTTLVQVSTTYMQILTSLSRSGWLHSYRSWQLTCRYWQACPGLGDYTRTGLDNLHADIDKPVQVWVTTLVQVSTTYMQILTSLSRSGWLHSYRSRQLTCRYWQACPGLGDYTRTGLDNLHGCRSSADLVSSKYRGVAAPPAAWTATPGRPPQTRAVHAGTAWNSPLKRSHGEVIYSGIVTI